MADGSTDALRAPADKTVEQLANAFILAKPDPDAKAGPGGAVFLIGAGCSASAGIVPASGVAQFCAIKLARKLSMGAFDGTEPDPALDWLIDKKHVTLRREELQGDGSHWGPLYQDFFERHFQSANMQREIINDIIEKGGNKLNWAHACLGELVSLGYAHTVLTTNFDQLVLQGIIRTGVMPVTADGLEALTRIDGRPKRPQVVHLHGSMHTYDLRNSPAALAATSQDSTAQAMIHSLMKDCDLLVVVGYGGGEEGIMSLLKEAGRVLPNLVVYWVTMRQGAELLSPNARELLSGDNKYLVWGGTADKFFGDLMAAMSLGQPRWVKDPIKVLKQQSDLLVAPRDDLEELSILVAALKERVDYANEHRWDEQNRITIDAAEKRARGNYQGAYDLLGPVDRKTNLKLARQHALNAFSIYETRPEANAALLEEAIAEFEHIVAHSDGEERLENIQSLCLALISKSEAVEDNSSAASREPLERVVATVREWLSSYPEDVSPLGQGHLKLLLAQALQALSEKPYQEAGVIESQAAYEDAIRLLTIHRDPEGRLRDASSGLAAVLQVRGEADNNPELIREAVRRHRAIVEASRSADGTIEEAGPLENFAESLRALARSVDLPEATAAYEEAKTALERVVGILRQLRDDGGEAAARSVIAEIEQALEGK